MSVTDYRRVLARRLPDAQDPTEHAIFATAFVRELEKKAPPEGAFLQAIEVLDAYRRASTVYLEGGLEGGSHGIPYR